MNGSPKLLPQRGFTVVVVLALILVGLPTQYISPLSAQMEDVSSADDGIALWANATGGQGGLIWSTSSSIAEGLVHSNRDLTINGSNNSMLGGTEYARRLRVIGRINIINPPATKVSPTEFPVTFDIADFRPGGVVALAAGSQYYDGTTECEIDGTWERHVQGTEIFAGLHYVPCDVIISAADITGSFTIVAEGTIQVTAARMTLGPAFTDDLLLFSNAELNNAILIAGENSALDGFVYAPLGSVMLAGANHSLRCGILADEIAINGWGHHFIGDPTCGNRTPIAVDDAYFTDEDVELSVTAPGMLGNDTDADGDPLTASLVTDVSNGTLDLQSGGSFTYMPYADFYGADSFSYQACDTGTPPLCATAQVTITVNAVNDPPVADANGPYTGLVGNPVLFDGSGSSDVDGTIVSYDWDFGDSTTGSGATPSHPYATAGLYTVTLTVTDDRGLTDTVSTTAEIAEVPNTAPVAEDDAYTTDEDVELSVTAPGVLENDTDADTDPLTASLTTSVLNGTLTLNPDGSFTYNPNPNYNGEDSFTYVAKDGKADSNIATVTLTVKTVNDPPVADANGPYSELVGNAVTFDGSGSSDVDGTIVSYDWDFGDGNTGSGATPSHTYAAAGFYTVTLTVTDDGGLTDTASTTAEITGIPNTAPIAVDNAYTTDEDVELSVTAPGVLGNDTDADSDPLTAWLVAGVTNGILTLNTDGSFTYVPSSNFYGVDSFTYRANDGTADSNIATVTLTVKTVNDPPVADANGPYSELVGNAVTFDGSGSSDVDGTIVSYDWDFGDGNTGSGATPSHTYAAADLYTVTLTVTDDGGLTDTASTTAEITGIPNTAPIAVDNAHTTDEDVELSVAAPGVLGNDSDADDDPLTASLVTDVSNGTLNLQTDGSFTYAPDLNFNGEDSFTYVANDGKADSNTATVTINVDPVNDPPMADAGPDQAVTVGDLVTLDGTGSSDPVEGDSLTYLWGFLTRPDGSTASLTNATSVAPTFIPDLPGDFVIELTVDDGNSGTATDTLTVSADPIGMTISLVDTLIGVGRTTDGTITLDNPAPPGGITVTLSLDTAIATVDPTDVPIAGGATAGNFVVTGVAVGTTMISGISPATEMDTAEVEVTDHLISIGSIPIIGPDESADLPVSITKPAPPGGVTILLESLDPTIAVTDPTTFIPEGQYVPIANPQITGVSMGTTQIRGEAPGLYAPDTREVTVALQVTLTPAELDLPESWTLYVTAHLSAPAPSGGVTLDLSLDDPTLATVPATVFIPAGQTLSAPIGVTAGITLGTTTLRASGAGLIVGTTEINVIDTPDVWVQQLHGTWNSWQPLLVGLELQFDARVHFEVLPPVPVDVIVSVPPGSGVLLSASPTEMGSESLVVATGITNQNTTKFYVQGTIQGDDTDDDVPMMIDVFEAGTMNPVGFEQTDMPSKVDVGPSGFSFSTGADLDVTTFPNQNIEVQAYLLNDGESGTLHNRRYAQEIRGGHTITVDLTNSNTTVGMVVTPAVFTGGNDYRTYAVFDGLTAGTTALDIVQPTSHTEPANGYLTRNINVTAPDVWVQQLHGTWNSWQPLLVGLELQFDARVHFEVLPPVPVDVIVSVPPGSGVLLSASPTEMGSESLVVATGITNQNTTKFYVQGTIQGDDTDDDVPMMIDVFEAGTMNPVGFEQTDMPSKVDVGPSGFSFSTGADINTTTLSPNQNIEVQAYLLNDGESGTLHNRRYAQEIRGGHTITVDLTNSNTTVGMVVTPAVFTGGNDYRAYAVFDPLTAGTTTLGIVQPADYINPANGYLTRNVNVDAPNLYLQTLSGSNVANENIGRDLQVERRIRLEVAPPAPGVDVTIEVIDPSVALISTDPTTVGSASITFPLVTGTYTPLIYVQGLALGQGTELRITAPGYDQWITTVQVVQAGFYIYSPSDFSTTVNASNTTFRVRSASLDNLQRVDEIQQIRGGASFSVDVLSSDPSVGAITVSPLIFTGDIDILNTAFDPLSEGTTTISITQPPGFTPPVGRTSIVATVNP